MPSRTLCNVTWWKGGSVFDIQPLRDTNNLKSYLSCRFHESCYSDISSILTTFGPSKSYRIILSIILLENCIFVHVCNWSVSVKSNPSPRVQLPGHGECISHRTKKLAPKVKLTLRVLPSTTKSPPPNFASLWEAVFVLSDKMRHIVDEANDR